MGSYKVATRTSPLALKQVEEILTALKKFYPAMEVEIVGIDTYGDKDRNIPISDIEGSDFFTREIDQALINGKIDGSTTFKVDFAVHSAKDLPDRLKEGLVIAAVTSPIDQDDVLVSKSGLPLVKLPYGAKIGTSSQRRKEALRNFRADFQIVDIRGNIEERLRQLDYDDLGKLDAIVLAAAGLLRLGLEQRISQRLPFDIFKPHPLQGALAVVAGAKDLRLLSLLSAIDSREVVLS